MELDDDEPAFRGPVADPDDAGCDSALAWGRAVEGLRVSEAL